MNHESEVLDKNVLFYIFEYILRYPEQAIWSISGEAHVSFEIPSKAKNSLCSRPHARIPGTVDFSLFTPIRVLYYLRAVDTRVSGIDFPTASGRITNRGHANALFIEPTPRNALHAAAGCAMREKCIRNRRWGEGWCLRHSRHFVAKAAFQV